MIIYKGESENEESRQQICTIQGTVVMGSWPKWRQVGEDETVRMGDQYLCLKINEANVFRDINDGGDASVWIEAKWGGVVKKSRMFKRPHVNQILYFKIPIPPSKRKKDIEFEQYLTEELLSKSEVEICVWADTHKMTIDNIGSGKICLSNIGNNNVQYQDLDFIDP